jgi:hypothetical protein
MDSSQVHNPTPANDNQLDETLEFLSFSHVDTGYKGLVHFVIRYPCGEDCHRYVKVEPERVQCFKDLPEHEKSTCEVHMNRDTFFKVYLNEIHPRNAVLSGAVRVRNWAFRELQKFGLSFDLSTEKWAAYYEMKGVEFPSASSPTANSSCLSDSETSNEDTEIIKWASEIFSAGFEGSRVILQGLADLVAPTTAVCEEMEYSCEISSQQIQMFQDKLNTATTILPSKSTSTLLFNSCVSPLAAKSDWFRSKLDLVRPAPKRVRCRDMLSTQPFLPQSDHHMHHAWMPHEDQISLNPFQLSLNFDCPLFESAVSQNLDDFSTSMKTLGLFFRGSTIIQNQFASAL